jgi:large subunit ribosomal protein L4
VKDKPKTKVLKNFLDTLGINDVLIVVPERNLILEKSVDNLPKVKVLAVEGLNVYDILNHQNLILAKDALPKIEERLRR